MLRFVIVIAFVSIQPTNNIHDLTWVYLVILSSRGNDVGILGTKHRWLAILFVERLPNNILVYI